MLKVGGLFADLTLRTTDFLNGLRQVVQASKQTASHIEKSIGDTPQKAAKKVRSASREAGKDLKENLGDKPKKAINETKEELGKFTWALRGYLKDTFRVVSGILISQVFYTILRWIRMTIGEALELQRTFEEAALSFRYLLDLTETQAVRLAQHMRYWALDTAFSISEVTRSFQDLVIAGLGMRDIEPAMQIIAGAATAMGRPLSEIVSTLIQIRAATVVSTSELRRLARAGLNVGPILREQLGLTHQELLEINKLQIPGEVMFRALLLGMEDFADAAVEGSKTVRALTADFVEVLRDVMGTLFQRQYERWRDNLENMVGWVARLREGIIRVGPAFLFDLFPPRVAKNLEIIVASLRAIWDGIRRTAAALRNVFGDSLTYITAILAHVLPILATLVQRFADLIGVLTSNIPVIRAVTAAIAGLTVAYVAAGAVRALLIWLIRLRVVKLVARSLIYTGAAIAFVAKNALILAGILALILGNFQAVKGLLEGLGASISNAFGEFPRKSELEDTADGIQDIVDGFEEIGDAAETAHGKFKPFLAAFDEVYQVPEMADDGVRDWPDLPWPDLELPFDPLDYRDIMAGMAEDTSDAFGKIIDTFENFSEYFQGWKGWLLGLLLIFAGSILKWMIAGLVGIPGKIALYLGYGFLVLKGWLLGLPKKILLFLKGLPVILWTWIKGSLWPKILLGLKFVGAKLLVALKWIGGLVTGSIALWPLIIMGIIAALVVGVVLWFRHMGYDIREVANNIRDWVVERFNNLRDAAIERFNNLRDSVVNTFNDVRDRVTETVNNIRDSIVERFNNARNTVVDIVNNIRDSIVERFNNARDWVVSTVNNIRDSIVDRFDNARNQVTEITQNMRDSIVGRFNDARNSVTGIANNIRDTISSRFNAARDWVTSTATDLRNRVVSRMTNLRNTLSNIWDSIRSTVSNKWSRITTPIRGAINTIIGYVNRLIDAWNRIEFRIEPDALPTWIPAWIRNQLTRFSLSTPNIRRIPHLQRGGIVTRDTLARVGEGNRREAVLPLDEAALAPFAEALVRAMGRNDGLQPVYVGTLVADDRGLRELNRRMKVIEVRESGRRAN